jgi:DNA helicase-2/ATP-dependent DNA helicase PcrA
MIPSPQQAAFYDFVTNGSGSCVLEAVAGAGKTTTLVEALSLMTGDVFFGAYNKAIAAEIKGRVPEFIDANVDVATFHAAGFRFWRRVAKKVTVDANKCRDIFRASYGFEFKGFESAALQLVSLAKQAGVGIKGLKDDTTEVWMTLVDHFNVDVPMFDGEEAPELLVNIARQIIQNSVVIDEEVIDFDDMIYAPLYHNVRVWRHDWVLVDEAQDTNATRRELALRMLKDGGRLIAVGDPRQAIYGFTGADADSLDLIAKATNAIRLPLTVTYRCPKAVVRTAQQWVSHIVAHETAPEGEVLHADIADLSNTASPGDAVLCRFNAPLVANVYAFIANGVPAKIEGRDIADGLKKLAMRWKIDSLSTLETRLDQYLKRETSKLIAADKDSLISLLEDKVECLRVLINRVRTIERTATVASLLAEIDRIFGAEGQSRDAVVFSSVHKSKGREWNRVVWLTTGPSPYARQQWELGQEDNLCYVAATRAKQTLVMMPVPVKRKD